MSDSDAEPRRLSAMNELDAENAIQNCKDLLKQNAKLQKQGLWSRVDQQNEENQILRNKNAKLAAPPKVSKKASGELIIDDGTSLEQLLERNHSLHELNMTLRTAADKYQAQTKEQHLEMKEYVEMCQQTVELVSRSQDNAARLEAVGSNINKQVVILKTENVSLRARIEELEREGAGSAILAQELRDAAAGLETRNAELLDVVKSGVAENTKLFNAIVALKTKDEAMEEAKELQTDIINIQKHHIEKLEDLQIDVINVQKGELEELVGESTAYRTMVCWMLTNGGFQDWQGQNLSKLSVEDLMDCVQAHGPGDAKQKGGQGAVPEVTVSGIAWIIVPFLVVWAVYLLAVELGAEETGGLGK
ncbi:hypothetical protein EJ08DRAFT_728785 [Tothia fuscella]|uniref:Uncharacterized protein n=1 Tax=Tothia fuscella TaxID=1048955 RepID=A0A9P4P2J9_9PEZI|nr:hypothetical protein EJ08DRAFT_728785 [Tothia fuscella]